MDPMPVFVSHSHHDNEYVSAFVRVLRAEGAEIWYDEEDMPAAHILNEIQRELRMRQVFIVILSKAALSSEWVQQECEWAHHLYRRERNRIILPVVAEAIDPQDLDQMLFLVSFKRVERSEGVPLPFQDATEETVRLLSLKSNLLMGIHHNSTISEGESAADVLTRGKALVAQRQYLLAIPVLEQATRLAPDDATAWANLGRAYDKVGRFQDGMRACESAIRLAPDNAWAWLNQGNALRNLHRSDDALEAFEKALKLDEQFAWAWINKGVVLQDLRRPKDALVAYERAIAIDPTDAISWVNRGIVLRDLRRFDQALESYEQALALTPGVRSAWGAESLVSRAQKRASQLAGAKRTIR